jgi:hypothetical protein
MVSPAFSGIPVYMGDLAVMEFSHEPEDPELVQPEARRPPSIKETKMGASLIGIVLDQCRGAGAATPSTQS